MDGATPTKIAPCQQACPAGIDVPRYVRHLRHGQFAEALDVIRERIPFPLVCGHACYHPCEDRCARRQLDTPVAIRLLKRVAAERGASGSRPRVALGPTGRRVAIVGAGPCGLTAGWFLGLFGHAVTVFEAMDRAGGMLRYGIPAYRLPDRVLDADLATIAAAGVEIRTGTRIASAEGLLADGFDAVLVASGAWRGGRLGIPGEDRAEVLDGIGFLAAVNAGGLPDCIGPCIVVVGGGNTAIDAARVGRRLGAEVTVAYRRAREDMPAHPEEVAAALAEGVAFAFRTAPVRIGAGRVTCVRTAPGPVDASGRPRAEVVAASEHDLPADCVIVAVGQQVESPGLATRGDGTIAAEAGTLRTAIGGIFAGGDAASGPASVIEAIAAGRRAAASIDRTLGGSGDLARFDAPPRPAEPEDPAPLGSARLAPAMLAPADRLKGFRLVEDRCDAAGAAAEAARCLNCDLRFFGVRVDPALCKSCGYCGEVCGPGVFVRTTAFNEGGFHPFAAANEEACVGCLACLQVCPDFAITIGPAGHAAAAAHPQLRTA